MLNPYAPILTGRVKAIPKLLMTAMSIVDKPSVSRLSDMTTRPPKRSYSLPRKGCDSPFTSMPMDIAADMSVRDHSRSPVIGTTKTPKPFLAPMETNRAKNPRGEYEPSVEDARSGGCVSQAAGSFRLQVAVSQVAVSGGAVVGASARAWGDSGVLRQSSAQPRILTRNS